MSYIKEPKTFGFGLRAFKKFPELIPLCAIIGVAIVGCTSYALYSFTKLDVQVRRNEIPPWERVDLENPKKAKFMTFFQEYPSNPELKKLKAEFAPKATKE